MGFHGWALGLDLSIEADQIKKSVNWGAKKKKNPQNLKNLLPPKLLT